jgi:hypothetical protein
MSTIHDPEDLLRSLSQRPVDTEALAAARSDIDRRIAALSRSDRLGLTAPAPHRRPRPALVIAVAATVMVAVAAVGLNLNRTQSQGAVVAAAGPEGFVVPASQNAPFWCEERADHITYDDAVDGGVSYLIDDAPDPEVVITRTVEACHGAAIVASSLVRVQEDGALTGAVTLWGPNAVDPTRWLSGANSSTTDVILDGGESASMRTYDSAVGDAGGLDGVTILTWSDSDGDWVLTSSGLGAELSLDLAGAAATGGSGAMAAFVPDFLDMTPEEIGGPSGISWIAMYGAPDAIENSFPQCPKTGGCFPSDAAGIGDHLTLVVETYGTQDLLPWAVRASTRTLTNPYYNTSAVYRVVDINGEPGLFKTAGETGLEGSVEWQIAPGVLAGIRGTWGGSIEGVLDFAESVDAVQADDPRLPEPFDPDATP